VRDLFRVLRDAEYNQKIKSFLEALDIDTCPRRWCVDSEKEEYLIKRPPRTREEAVFNQFLFFTKGRLIELSCLGFATGEISFQNFPKEFENSRREIQENLASALLLYGAFGDGKIPIEAKYIDDDVRPPCL
jgi:hypothetical protein